MKNHILTIVLAFTISLSFAQETATVYIARKGLWTGTAGAVKIFNDGKIICELKNNSFSVHQVPTGSRSFHAQWYGKSSADPAKKNETEVELEAGKEYYFQLVKQEQGVWSYIHVQEVTASTWKKLKEKLKEDDCH